MWLVPPPRLRPATPREALVAFDERAAYVYRPGAEALVRSVVLPSETRVIAASYSAPLRRLLTLTLRSDRYAIIALDLAASGTLRATRTLPLPRSKQRPTDLAADPKRPFVYLTDGGGITSFVLGRRGLRRDDSSDTPSSGIGELILSPDGRTALVLGNDSMLDNQFGAVTSYRRLDPSSPRFRLRTSIDLSGIGTGGGTFTPDGRRAYVVGWFPEILVLAVDPEGRLKIRRRGGVAHSAFAYDPVSATFFAGNGPSDVYDRVGRFSVKSPDRPNLLGEKRLGSLGELVVSARNRSLYEISEGVSILTIAPDGALGRTSTIFRTPSRLVAPALMPMPSQ